jgi:4-hydroxybenzoate polyprenyltransferase
MIRRVRLMLIVARPAVLVLLGLFAAIGLAQAERGQAGNGQDWHALGEVLVVVFGYLLFSVACNDIADEAIDRVNLPRDRRRPLVAGTANRRDLTVVGLAAATAAVAVSATLSWPAVLVTVAGLLVSAGYSLRPVRLADRGAVASLVLPACYVGVPYLLGILAVRDRPQPRDLVLLAGLYVGFIGRILLKDFRDLRGDALFGKRTFLVRHGRRWTCVFSACCWLAGSAVIVVAAGPRPAFVAATAGYALLAVLLLRVLAADGRPHRDDALVAGVAVAGRGAMVTLLAHLSMTRAGWPPAGSGLVIGALFAMSALQVAAWWRVARREQVRGGVRSREMIPG